MDEEKEKDFKGMSGACFIMWEMSKQCQGVYQHFPADQNFLAKSKSVFLAGLSNMNPGERRNLID